MPKSIGDFINELAQKAGIPKDNEHLTAFLSSDADLFNKIKVPDELVSSLDNSLLSLEVAKNNHPAIKNHYFASALNGVDSELNAIMDELQVPDPVKVVVLNEKSTPKRAALLIKKVKELESAKKNTDDKGEKASLQQQINELNDKLRQEKDGIQRIKDEYEGKIANMRLNSRLETMLSNYKTVFDDLPAEARNNALHSLLQKTLQDKNAVLKIDENGQLVLTRTDGANVFGDDNRQWNPQTLIENTLSQNKLLKVTDPKPANGQGNNNPVIVNGGNPAGDNPSPKKDTALSALVKASMADQEAASQRVVM